MRSPTRREVSPSGQPRMARTWFWYWQHAHASMVKCPLRKVGSAPGCHVGYVTWTMLTVIN
jgi:hypothetical protein